jgi:aldehyde:ferredoxin oxidoreductase
MKITSVFTKIGLISIIVLLSWGCGKEQKAALDENIAKNYLGRRVSCAHCPISCIHIAALREPYRNEPYFYKTTMISYDYEPSCALGTMLNIASTEGLLQLMDEIEVHGLDAINTGVALAWATEAQEKGSGDLRQHVAQHPNHGRGHRGRPCSGRSGSPPDAPQDHPPE